MMTPYKPPFSERLADGRKTSEKTASNGADRQTNLGRAPVREVSHTNKDLFSRQSKNNSPPPTVLLDNLRFCFSPVIVKFSETTILDMRTQMIFSIQH